MHSLIDDAFSFTFHYYAAEHQTETDYIWSKTAVHIQPMTTQCCCLCRTGDEPDITNTS